MNTNGTSPNFPAINTNDITIGHLTTPQTRARSGSLFSNNSIWNDDVNLNPSPINHEISQISSASVRSRSYTTTGALPNMTDFLHPNQSNNNNNNNLNLSTSPMKITIDPPPQHQPRLRSQTISTPIGIDQPQNSNLLSQPQFQPQHQHGINHQPSLYDNSDFRNLNLTTTFQNPNLGPTKYLLFDNLPFYIDSLKLNSIISNSSNQRSLGNIISIKITTTTTSKLALIECSNIETAMNLKASFNHLELVPGSTLYVAFAKIEDSLPQQRSPLQVPLQTTQPPQPQSQSSATSSTTSAATTSTTSGQSQQQQPAATAQQQQQSSYLHHSLSESSSDKPGPTDVVGIQKSLMSSINKLSSTVDTKKIQSIIDKCIAYPQKQYQNDFGPLPDPIPLRQFDSPTLRELRKTLENNEVFLLGQDVDSESEGGVMTEFQLEELCLAMLDELPELCYDYLGNTIVQKIFTLVESPLIKLMMVKEIAPFLTQLGIHKNGTWAIQKIINLCHSDYQQMYLIGASLKPYAVKLFNDQFGNYVIQGCIKFGSPFNDFVFEAMLDNFLEISVGRFGARCIRTILESCHDNTPTSPVSNEQVLLVAGLIVEYANELVVNSNGSLLITWYLDTFNDCDSKIELLMSKFLPSLRSLCVHKLANLTILKILSNRIDQNSRITIIESIFSNTESLEYILQDSENSNTAAGPLFIYKILSNSILGDLANQYVPTIRKILMELNIVNFQNYKKLMDEVGISSTRIGRNGSMKRNGNGVARRGNHNGNYRGNKHDNGYIPFPQQNQHQHQHQQQQQQQQQSYFSSNLAPSLSPSQLPIQQPQQNINSQYSSQYIHLQPSQQYPVLTPQMYMKQMYGQQQQQQQSSFQLHQPQPQQQLQQPQQQLQQPQQQLSPQELAVMQQLEQLSLSSAALGYNSNPGTPTLQRNSFN